MKTLTPFLVHPTPIINPNRLAFKPREVFVLLGLSHNAGYEWIRTGRIRAVRTEGKQAVRYLIPREELMRLLGKTEQAKAPEI
jgi:excisionase family DNA binding protein